jgi:hypothetical protein
LNLDLLILSEINTFGHAQQASPYKWKTHYPLFALRETTAARKQKADGSGNMRSGFFSDLTPFRIGF